MNWKERKINTIPGLLWEESVMKKKYERRRKRNQIINYMPQIILWLLTLCSLAEMIFCIWACMEKYRIQVAAVSGLGFISFIAGVAALVACRAPIPKITDRNAIIVRNEEILLGASIFLAVAGIGVSVFTVNVALEEMWDGILVMGTLEALVKLCASFYITAYRNRYIVLLSNGTLLCGSVMGRRKEIRVSQIGKLEVSLASNKFMAAYIIRGIDREGKKQFTFDTAMEEGGILYEKLEELQIPVKGRTWTKRGLSLEELLERKYLYSRETEDYHWQQRYIGVLKRIVWVLLALMIVGCAVFHLILPMYIPRKYCLFFAALLPLGDYLLCLIFPQIVVPDDAQGAEEVWKSRHVMIPTLSFLVVLLNGIGICYFILADYCVADGWKLALFCLGISIIFAVPVLVRIPKLLRNPNNIFSVGAYGVLLGIGLGLAITLLSMGNEQVYQAQIADTRTKEAESRTVYYVYVTLKDGKTVKVDAPVRIYALASGGFPMTVKEWEGVWGIRFFNLYEEE